MININGNIDFKEIKRISPSQFYSMKNCAYKSLLAEAFEKKPLLPISPNAYFGTLLHRMLELIIKGSITNEDEFDELAWCYVHEQEIITKEIMEKWIKNWCEQYEKDLQTRNLFAQEILMFLNNKKFELQEIQKLKQKLDILGFKKCI